MTDDELIASFESTELPAEQFSHEAHMRAEWWYLRHSPLPDAIPRFSAALKRFAAAKGAHGKYHETITVAYMLVIAQRLDGARESSWEEFAAANPDLLVSKPSVLAAYYSDALLSSDRARRTSTQVIASRCCQSAGSHTAKGVGAPALQAGRVLC